MIILQSFLECFMDIFVDSVLPHTTDDSAKRVYYSESEYPASDSD